MDNIEQAKHLERAWIRDRALSGEILDDRVRSTYDYLIRLTAVHHISSSTGEQFDISHDMTEIRAELLELMKLLSSKGWHYPDENAREMNGIGTIACHGHWHRPSLVESYPTVSALLSKAMQRILTRFPALTVSDLEAVLRQKRLVLALGGGGGTGFAHLCLFQWLEENGLTPELITGTSIGALLGLMRALNLRYDAAMTAVTLPSLWKIIRSIRPAFTTGRYGLMGMYHIDMESIVGSVTAGFGLTKIPRFNELKIPFACVASGISAQDGIADSVDREFRPSGSIIERIKRFSIHGAIRHTVQIASLINRTGAVRQTVFGFDSLTSPMTVADAVAFSALVPGILTYDLPIFRYKNRRILNAVFKRDALYRLADGGLASNVPVRAARNAIQSGRFGHENIYLLGIDVFAPQPRDGIFYPLECIANENAKIDAFYADSFVRLEYLLSPLNLIPNLNELNWLNASFRKTFAREMQILTYALRPLSTLSSLNI